MQEMQEKENAMLSNQFQHAPGLLQRATFHQMEEYSTFFRSLLDMLTNSSMQQLLLIKQSETYFSFLLH